MPRRSSGTVNCFLPHVKRIQKLVGSRFIVRVDINEIRWSIKQYYEKKGHFQHTLIFNSNIYIFKNWLNDISICAIFLRLSIPPPKCQHVCSELKVTFILLPLLFVCSFCIPSSSSSKLSALAILTRSRMSRQSPFVLRLHPSFVVWHFYSLFFSYVYVFIKEQIFRISSTRSSPVLSSGVFLLLWETFPNFLRCCCLILFHIWAVQLISSYVFTSFRFSHNFRLSSELAQAHW